MATNVADGHLFCLLQQENFSVVCGFASSYKDYTQLYSLWTLLRSFKETLDSTLSLILSSRANGSVYPESLRLASKVKERLPRWNLHHTLHFHTHSYIISLFGLNVCFVFLYRQKLCHEAVKLKLSSQLTYNLGNF